MGEKREEVGVEDESEKRDELDRRQRDKVRKGQRARTDKLEDAVVSPRRQRQPVQALARVRVLN